MKIFAIKDKSGKTVATFENNSKDGATVTPVLTNGHTVHEMEVAENYQSNLSALYA